MRVEQGYPEYTGLRVFRRPQSHGDPCRLFPIIFQALSHARQDERGAIAEEKTGAILEGPGRIFNRLRMLQGIT